MLAFVSAVTAPVPASACVGAITNFEELCAAKPLALKNACFAESRAAKV
jgi:hypothetical protein